jgi:hypothetical protein
LYNQKEQYVLFLSCLAQVEQSSTKEDEQL